MMTKPQLKLQFKKAWSLISGAENIFMTTHEGTDGDDLGSLLAMYHVLKRMGKKSRASIKGGVPATLGFLPESNIVVDKFVENNYDLVMIFGARDFARTGLEEVSKLSVPVINFDHHPDNTFFGEVNIVDQDAAAVAELVYYFIQSGKIKIDKEMATCLLTGLFTDTGGFKHANTTSEALEVAADLMKKGARIDKIAKQTMTKHRP